MEWWNVRYCDHYYSIAMLRFSLNKTAKLWTMFKHHNRLSTFIVSLYVKASCCHWELLVSVEEIASFDDLSGYNLNANHEGKSPMLLMLSPILVPLEIILCKSLSRMHTY